VAVNNGLTRHPSPSTHHPSFLSFPVFPAALLGVLRFLFVRGKPSGKTAPQAANLGKDFKLGDCLRRSSIAETGLSGVMDETGQPVD
jgi:hypothetical protein